ncbi:hypothetical protein PoB_005586700 [Plakobranchus ocellatus]|uniref:PiggyBac transposable element-derived protein domain-containing protein n=1 Tax=Plakobranchus ocellatus TaxID=259542 RepID=A0AAV4CDF6_9GAST|nr:hypothetical protein PoB_005586700 [Plakobranchus ocellatus]
MLVRVRCESIHRTMLHCADSEAESTEKIQPFINSLLEEYYRAFYPFQELSLDEMVVGWKGSSTRLTILTSLQNIMSRPLDCATELRVM